MKPRTILILAVLLLILIPLARFTQRQRLPAPTGDVSPGNPVLPGLDVNAVTRMEVAGTLGTSVVARKDGVWRVESLHDYPADFSRVASELRKLADLKVGQVYPNAADQLADFGLAASGDEPIGPMDVSLRDTQGAELARITIGNARTGTDAASLGLLPEGHYVRAGEGPVLLVDENFSGFPRRPDQWVNRTLLDIPSTDVARVTVRSGDSGFTLTSLEQGEYKLDGLGNDQEIDTAEAAKLARLLQMLQFAEVVDPARTDAELGFESPSTIEVHLRNGLQYIVTVGRQPAGPNNRYVRLAASYEAPPAPSGQDESQAEDLSDRARAENERLQGWTFSISKPKSDHLVLTREQLIKKPAPPPEQPGPIPMERPADEP